MEPKSPLSELREFAELQSSGLLWLINTVVFHPRGFALALGMEEGEAIGWRLMGDGKEPFIFSEDTPFDELFNDVEATFQEARNANSK